MEYTYTIFTEALSGETNIPLTNTAFSNIIPVIIDQAEGMIYREPGLEFLSTMVRDDSGFTTVDDRAFTLPRVFSVLHTIARVDGNDRTLLTKVSREVLDFIYPRRISESAADVPEKWAPFTDQIVYLGPVPGGEVQLECVGEVRPAQLSSTNPTTWLWTYLGDLAFAAAMIMASGYMRNFGSQADDAKMAMSWKAVYDGLLPGAQSQEMRRKHAATGGGV
jgi:hypothetical protein